jgi:head-tail adaptor
MSGAGKLQHRLQFSVRSAPVEDGFGNTIAGEFIPQFEAWCGLTFLKGSETVLASRLEGRSPVVITMRSSINARRITHEWRATNLKTGVVFEIKEQPRPTEDRAYLEMLAESGVAA